ncbi:MAG: LysR family transcriptional regulator [Mesorhizobium amorphae]|nr:MAG: LysR family transcriptional regulator [Mesorhizobium amorphae]
MSAPISWDDHRIFLAVLEAGSLAGAARALGLSHPTVRARLTAFEAALGTVLFTRSNNGLAPTETAERLRDTARSMAMAADLLRRQASAESGEIAGSVRLSVPDIMGVELMPAMLQPLLEKHRKLSIELSLSNAQADVLAHEVDIAVRTVSPAQGSLIARRVARYPIGLFASADYLARRGVPASLEELGGHTLVGPDRNPVDLGIAARLGLSFAPDRLALKTDSHPAQLAAARAGLGIAPCPQPVAAADPTLVRVLPDIVLHELEVWTVTHVNLAKVSRIRKVLDHLAERFGKLSAMAAPAD